MLTARARARACMYSPRRPKPNQTSLSPSRSSVLARQPAIYVSVTGIVRTPTNAHRHLRAITRRVDPDMLGSSLVRAVTCKLRR